jgi:hypothetical protein
MILEKEARRGDESRRRPLHGACGGVGVSIDTAVNIWIATLVICHRPLQEFVRSRTR